MRPRASFLFVPFIYLYLLAGFAGATGAASTLIGAALTASVLAGAAFGASALAAAFGASALAGSAANEDAANSARISDDTIFIKYLSGYIQCFSLYTMFLIIYDDCMNIFSVICYADKNFRLLFLPGLLNDALLFF